MNKVEAIDWQLGRAREAATAAQHALESAQDIIVRLNDARNYALSEAPVFSGSDARCTACGADVSTERLFSAHYVITDPRYYNLGECPNKR